MEVLLVMDGLRRFEGLFMSVVLIDGRFLDAVGSVAWLG